MDPVRFPRIEYPSGIISELSEGEFRSKAGRLLFVRRGQRLEIRCPRSKELSIIHLKPEPPAAAG